jgi:hypothetical protein
MSFLSPILSFDIDLIIMINKKIPFLLIILLWSSVLCAETFDVRYVGGGTVAATPENPIEGKLQVEKESITFWNGKPNKSAKIFEFPTSVVTELLSGEKAQRRAGVRVAIAVVTGPIGFGVRRFRKRHEVDVVAIEFKNPKTGRSDAPAFLVYGNKMKMIKKSLEDNTGKKFVVEED